MFENLGKALALTREMRGLSQSSLARAARIGKSQVSKYEGGKEYPKFETLEKILAALHVSPHQFSYIFYLVDTSARALLREEEGWTSETPPLLTQESEATISRLLGDIVALHRSLFEGELRRRSKGR